MESRQVFPLVHTIAVDNPEHCILAGTLYGYGTNCQCSACLTPKDALGDVTGAAQWPVRTMAIHKALSEAIDDASGKTAQALYTAHLRGQISVPRVGSKRTHDEAETDIVSLPSIHDAKEWANQSFKDMSYRKGIRPALRNFTAAAGGFAILGLSYDRLHMARLGAFKRLCILALAVYADKHGLKKAIEMLNSRFTARGKHDGLDRCILLPMISNGRARGVLQVLATRLVQNHEEKQGLCHSEPAGL
jgi:hypothetical protein